MSFFKWGRKKETEPDENEPVLAAVIKNPVTSEIFQDILKENGIPFICRQDGAGGSVKLLLGRVLCLIIFTLRRKITKRQEDFTRHTCKQR